MAERHNVELTTVSSLALSDNEVKQLYIRLALYQYRYLRHPNYPIQPLLETLTKDFKRYYCEVLELSLKEPNNLTLHQMRGFFEGHYKRLKGIVERQEW